MPDLTQAQARLVLPEDLRHPVLYGMSLPVAISMPGEDWAMNAVRAGHVCGMEGVEVLFKARMLANRSHLAQHDDVFCPADWECMDIVGNYRQWQGLLDREVELHLLAARDLK